MVLVRPDEKSVMTYVSLFWKEFANLKAKQMAAERIAAVLNREKEMLRVQDDYAAQARRAAAAPGPCRPGRAAS